MKLQQLRYVIEVAKQGLNISEASQWLHTSQPGISKQICLLEEELGVHIFIRNGKRIVDITEPGKEVLRIAKLIQNEVDNLKSVADEFSQAEEGSLIIATTYTQARYTLPSVVADFVRKYPKVSLSIKQGNPTQICEMVVSGEANLAIATESLGIYHDLSMLFCYEWNRSIILPHKHPLCAIRRNLNLDDLSKYPIITYDFAFSAGSNISKAFSDASLSPHIVLAATDTDVIKTYVRLGLGIGIVASMAFDKDEDSDLCAIDVGYLFEPSSIKVGVRKNSYPRSFVYDFIKLFAPHLSLDLIKNELTKKT